MGILESHGDTAGYFKHARIYPGLSLHCPVDSASYSGFFPTFADNPKVYPL